MGKYAAGDQFFFLTAIQDQFAMENGKSLLPNIVVNALSAIFIPDHFETFWVVPG